MSDKYRLFFQLEKALRYVWHGFYYVLGGGPGTRFAMTCKEVTEHIDLHKDPTTFSGRLRLRLHLTLCQACNNYLRMTKALKMAIRTMVAYATNPVQMDRLNQNLLDRYSKTK